MTQHLVWPGKSMTWAFIKPVVWGKSWGLTAHVLSLCSLSFFFSNVEATFKKDLWVVCEALTFVRSFQIVKKKSTKDEQCVETTAEQPSRLFYFFKIWNNFHEPVHFKLVNWLYLHGIYFISFFISGICLNLSHLKICYLQYIVAIIIITGQIKIFRI